MHSACVGRAVASGNGDAKRCIFNFRARARQAPARVACARAHISTTHRERGCRQQAKEKAKEARLAATPAVLPGISEVALELAGDDAFKLLSERSVWPMQTATSGPIKRFVNCAQRRAALAREAQGGGRASCGPDALHCTVAWTTRVAQVWAQMRKGVDVDGEAAFDHEMRDLMLLSECADSGATSPDRRLCSASPRASPPLPPRLTPSLTRALSACAPWRCAPP